MRAFFVGLAICLFAALCVWLYDKVNHNLNIGIYILITLGTIAVIGGIWGIGSLALYAIGQ